jgi:penicillin-binding protein 1A
MFKNSGLYNPVRREGVTNRRNVVLSQMQKGKIITKEEKKNLSLPIKLNFKLETHKDGTTYFREYLRDYMKKWAEENKNQMDQIMTFTKMV